MRGGVEQGQDVGDLAGLQLGDGGEGGGVGAQLGLIVKAHVAAVRRRLRVLGEIHGQRAEVFARVQPVLQRLDLLPRLGVGGGLASLQVAGLRGGNAGDADLGQMVLRLDQVELVLVLVVVVADIGVRYRDLGVDLLVQQLVDGERAAQVALDIVQGVVRCLQLRGELLLGVGRLHLRHFGVDVFGGRGEVHLGGALLDDLLLDQLLHHIEAERVGLLRRGLLAVGLAQLRGVHTVHVGAHDGVAVDRGHHIGVVGAIASGDQQKRDACADAADAGRTGPHGPPGQILLERCDCGHTALAPWLGCGRSGRRGRGGWGGRWWRRRLASCDQRLIDDAIEDLYRQHAFDLLAVDEQYGG